MGLASPTCKLRRALAATSPNSSGTRGSDVPHGVLGAPGPREPRMTLSLVYVLKRHGSSRSQASPRPSCGHRLGQSLEEERSRGPPLTEEQECGELRGKASPSPARGSPWRPCPALGSFPVSSCKCLEKPPDQMDSHVREATKNECITSPIMILQAHFSMTLRRLEPLGRRIWGKRSLWSAKSGLLPGQCPARRP